jgi:hypothetical protein
MEDDGLLGKLLDFLRHRQVLGDFKLETSFELLSSGHGLVEAGGLVVDIDDLLLLEKYLVL